MFIGIMACLAKRSLSELFFFLFFKKQVHSGTVVSEIQSKALLWSILHTWHDNKPTLAPAGPGSPVGPVNPRIPLWPWSPYKNWEDVSHISNNIKNLLTEINCKYQWKIVKFYLVAGVHGLFLSPSLASQLIVFSNCPVLDLYS